MYVCVCVRGVHMFWVGVHLVKESMREKCLYSELFWSAFSRIRTEYGEILRITRYSVRMWEMRTRITPNTNTFHAVSLSVEGRGFYSTLFILRAE